MSVTTPDNLCPLEISYPPRWWRTQPGRGELRLARRRARHRSLEDPTRHDTTTMPRARGGRPERPPQGTRRAESGNRSVGYPWATCGLRVDYAWTTRGLRVGYVWTTHAHVDRDRMRSARWFRIRLGFRTFETQSWQTVISPELARPGRQIFLLESRHVR